VFFPYLFLGSQREARKADLFNGLGITHVIVLDDQVTELFKKAKAAGKAQLYEYLVFDVQEAINPFLPKYFLEAFKFINDAKGEGNVLVQCPTGNSRAAIMCMAFFMQLRSDLSLQDVYDTIKEVRPSIDPHPDLLRQLQDFYQSLHPSAHLHVLDQLQALSIAESCGSSQPNPPQPEPQKVADPIPVQSDPLPPANATPTTTTQQVSEEDRQQQLQPQQPQQPSVQPTSRRFVCKNCRTPLFTQSDLLPHAQGTGQSSFNYRKRGVLDSSVTCTSFFLDEMEWMGNCCEVEGKLFCPVCVGRIGAWSWSGGQCSCGTWCTPSFRVSKARVDEKLQF